MAFFMEVAIEAATKAGDAFESWIWEETHCRFQKHT